jgi:hypothetical protein
MAHRSSSDRRFSTYCCGSQSCAFVVSLKCWRFSRTDSERAGMAPRLNVRSILLIILPSNSSNEVIYGD